MTTTQGADAGAEITRLGALAAEFRRRRELDPEIIYPAHADCLWQLGNLQIQAGEADQGLLGLSEAVALLRQLADAQPEAYTVRLVSALNSQASRLADADHPEEAMAVAAEAVELGERAMAAWPQEVRFILMSALVNLAGQKLLAGDSAATVTALGQAVEIFRAAGSAGEPLLNSMVESLHRAAMAFAEVGLWSEALTVRRQLIALFGDSPPGTVVQLLALTQQQASAGLVAAGRAAEGLAYAVEAVDLLRGLEAASPGIHHLALAQSLGNLAGRCRDAGYLKEGLDRALEAIDLFHHVVASDPIHAVPPLVATLDSLAGILDDLGLGDQAATVREQRAQLNASMGGLRPAG